MMSAEKRLTLPDLLSYVLTLTKNIRQTNQETPENQEQTIKVETIEDVMKFRILAFGDSVDVSDMPKNIKRILDPFHKEIKRTSSYNIKEFNYTLFDCILTCLVTQYKTIQDEKRIPYIKNLFDKLLSDIEITSNSIFTKYKYKQLGWTHFDIENSLKLYKNNKLVLRYLADYFSINIFLLNISEDKIYAIYGM